MSLMSKPVPMQRCLLVVSCHCYIHLAGMPFTSGLCSRSGVVASVDAPPLTLLKRAGAIPLGITNTSELCMWSESHNHLHGITRNPYDLERIPGGSSGQPWGTGYVCWWSVIGSLLKGRGLSTAPVVFRCSSSLSCVLLRRGGQFIGSCGLSHRGRLRYRRQHSHAGFLQWDIWT